MSKMKRKGLQQCRGQAVAELVAIAVGLVVVFAGVIQICLVGNESIQNLLAARTEADDNAMGNVTARSDEYVSFWSAGPDGLRFTADDDAQGLLGNYIGLFGEQLQEPVSLDYVASHGAWDGISPYVHDNLLSSASNLYVGRRTRSVELEEALRRLLFIDTDELHLKDEVYMPGLRIENGAP